MSKTADYLGVGGWRGENNAFGFVFSESMSLFNLTDAKAATLSFVP